MNKTTSNSKQPGISETLSVSFQILKQYQKEFSIYFAVITILPMIYFILVHRHFFGIEFQIPHSIELTLLYLMIAYFIGIAISQYVIINFVGDSYRKRRTSIILYLKQFKSDIIPYFATVFLAGIIVYFASFLLIIPGIVLYISYLFHKQVFIFKRKKFMDALNYSDNLIRGNGWRLFFLVFIFSVFYLQAYVSWDLFFRNLVWYVPIIKLIGIFISDLLSIVFFTVFYLKLEEIKERNLKERSSAKTKKSAAKTTPKNKQSSKKKTKRKKDEK